MLVRHAARVRGVVQCHHPGVVVGRHLRHIHRLQPHPDGGPHVRGDVVGASEGLRLEHAHDVERQELQLLRLRSHVDRLHHLLAHRVQTISALWQMRLQGRLQRDVRQHGRRGLHIHGVEDVVGILRSDARVGVHPDAALPLAVRVQQRTLHVHHRFGRDVLLHVEGDGEGLVGMAVRDHEQIVASDEQVAVELCDLPAAGDANAHDGLPAHVPGEHVLQLVLQLQAGKLDVEVRVVAHVATGVLRER
mmetsp:Transcript_103224/g.262089  ORF Transcript_103224/g.262089 Transcript_103224/m.262089 type:complete len:248 (-) Transcript_103224:937-1680(-)